MKKFERRAHFVFPLAAGLILTVFLASCGQITGFFSNSWGKGLARDPEKIFPAITGKNAQQLADETAGDPAAAAALLKKIKEAAKNASGAEKEALLKAGLTAANNASDLTGLLIGNATKLKDLSSADTDKALEDLSGIMKQAGNVSDTANDLQELFGGADSSTYNAMPPNELATAAFILALDETKTSDLSAEKIKDIVKNDPDPENYPKTKTAYEMIKTVKNDKDSLFGKIFADIDNIADSADSAK
jgi:hypothetical protein